MRRSIYWLTLLLAFCSIVYELLLAQTMGALLGNTLLRYNVTIGVYLASLGAGSLLCRREGPAASTATLIRIVAVGILSGFELPLLMRLGGDDKFAFALAFTLAAEPFSSPTAAASGSAPQKMRAFSLNSVSEFNL